MARAPSLYIHVPFCSSRCSYCDFHSAARGGSGLDSAAESWLAAIERHLSSIESRFGRTGFHTVYVGGGTPSWLPRGILSRALDLTGASAGAGGRQPAEWTVEANPEDVDDEFLHILADRRVGRLSVGVQSLEDAARRIARRRGDAMTIKPKLEAIARGWHGAWSADLMFGLPGQTPAGLSRDAAFIAGAGATHVSLYELTLEPGTPLHADSESGRTRLPDDDERADLYDAAAETLSAAGFRRYEVSNWAKTGYECIHNEVYWDMGDWLAVGPSGVGNLDAGNGTFLRMENSADDGTYFSDPAGSAAESTIGGSDAMVECLMTAMRTAKGFDHARFASRFGLDPEAVFGKLDELYPDLVRLESRTWTPTERGMDTLNVPLVQAMTNAETYFGSAEIKTGETQR